jgi:hypothetical protein
VRAEPEIISDKCLAFGCAVNKVLIGNPIYSLLIQEEINKNGQN